MSALRVNSGTLAGSIQNLIFESNAFRVVLLEPGFRGVGIREDLEVIDVANPLAGVDVDSRWSLFGLRLPPMMIFAIGIEHPLDMTIERLHDPNPRVQKIRRVKKVLPVRRRS
jgi:hypothetical protein